MNNVEIIKARKSIDLSTYPYDEVKGLVSQFAPKFLGIWIPRGHRIERIRPDANLRFTKHGIPVDMDAHGIKRWKYDE